MNYLPTSLPIAVLLATAAYADRIGLAGDDLVTGSVSGIDAQGRLVVDSPNAAAPLHLRREALRSIDFDIAPAEFPSHEELLHLANGDALPGTIRDMDAEHIDFQSWCAGDLRIPRSVASSLDFGVSPQPLVFKGPGSAEDWEEGDDWKFRGTSLVSSGRGTIARKKVLPDNFILRFQLAWETNPSFQFHFCDDYLKDGGETDRYYFDVNSGGLQLKRQSSSEGRSYHSLFSSQRRPDEFHDKNVEIELRVDRERRLIYIYVDGELKGTYPDQIERVPKGTGIMLKSNSGGDVRNIITSIEVYKWDAISQLHRSEGHEDPSLDAIITTDSERLPGEVQGMIKEEDERVLLLKNPHSDPLFHIPLRRASVLYFRQGDPPVSPTHSYLIEFAGQGRIQLSNLRLDEENLTGRHALLGEVSLKREALVRLQAGEPKNEEPSEDEDPSTPPAP